MFAHEDRMPAQQLQYSECAKQAKLKNDSLNREGRLDNPFRYVVRGDRVRCIDAIESRYEKKSVYVSEQQQLSHRKVNKLLNNDNEQSHAIDSASVADHRGSALQSAASGTPQAPAAQD